MGVEPAKADDVADLTLSDGSSPLGSVHRIRIEYVARIVCTAPGDSMPATVENPSLSQLLHRCSQRATAIFDKDSNRSELTLRQRLVLEAIAQRDSQSQTDLVSATRIDRSTMADIVRRLVGKGYVARKRSKDDARAYVIALTQKGSAVLKSGNAAATNLEDVLMGAVAAKDKAALIRALTAISAL